MAHVLYEYRLLPVSLLHQTGGLQQFLVAALSLVGSVADAAHVEVEWLQHGSKAVLQLSNGILVLRCGNLLFIIAIGYLLGLAHQLINRADVFLHDTEADPQDNQQTNDDKANNNISQFVIALHNTIIITYHFFHKIIIFYNNIIKFI